MADYEGLIRVGVQGISEIDRLNRGLERAAENFGNIENASIIANQIGQSANRRLESARRRMERAGYERTQANRILENVDQRRNPRTGRFEPGPNATARRLASANLRLAQRETREAARSLAEEERNRRLVSAAERRYAIALNEAADSMTGIQNTLGQRQDAIDQLTRRIGRESRGNYLTNLFQGRQAEFVRGGAGRNLPRNLQSQARANLAAWELTNVGGRENLPLMSRLATEISGLVRQQNEMNRRRTSRSTTYETGRRGQERITELARMPGADPEKIKRLRSQATQVIEAGYRNDAPEIRLTTRRMNASIARYQRELEAAARELREQRVAQMRNFNVRQGWLAISEEAQQRARQNRRALPDKNLLAERIARTPGGIAPRRLDELRKQEEKRLAEEARKAPIPGKRFREKLEAEQKRQERLGIGATAPMRVGAPMRRTGAIPLSGGIDSGILPRALPDRNLLAQRIARTPGAIAPADLIKLREKQQADFVAKQKSNVKNLNVRLGWQKALEDMQDIQLDIQRKSGERFRKKLEAEQKRQERLGIGVNAPVRVGGPVKRSSAIPMGGQGGRPGMFDQYSSFAGPGNLVGAKEFREIQRIARMRQIASPIQGTKDIVDSPAWKKEQERINRQGQRALREQRVAQMRNFNIRQSWLAISEEAQQIARRNQRALPNKNLLAERIARTPGAIAPTRLDELRKQEEKRLAEEAKKAPIPGKRFAEKLKKELERQERLGIGATAPMRVGAPMRRTGAIPMPGTSGFSQSSQMLGPGNVSGILEFQKRNQKTQERGEKLKTAMERQSSVIATRESRLSKLAEKGVDASQLQIRLDKAKALAGDSSVKAQEKFKRSIIDLDRNIARLSANAEKQAKAANAPQGLFRGDARKAIGESLIGGAFPLLFGQGAAASAGGLVGGAVGGAIGGSFGFGLSLIGTALGQAVDTTAQNLKNLAASLKSPSDAMAALETSGFRVSDSLKFQVEQLQAVGRGYDAQTLVLKEVERRLGAGSVKELSALNAEQKKLDESFASLTGRLQSGLIPALITVINTINGIVDLANRAGQIKIDPVSDSFLNALIPSKKPIELIVGGLQGRGRQIARASQAPSRSPQERFADETTRIQESRKIADQIQSAYREAFNLQRQAHDLQRDGATLNKEIADYTYRKEREIFDLRQQAAEKQIENNRAAAQNRIESGDLSARQTFAAAVGFEQQLLSNVREVVRARKEGEADIEQSRNRLELAMARLNRDTEDYKRTNAREIEDIERRKLAYVRSVEDYKMRVADYVRERSRQSADLMKQAMALPEVGLSPAGATSTPKTVPPTTGKAPNTLMGVKGIIEYLTGDTSSPGYRADHGGSNYHEHIAFASRQIRDSVIAMLRANGVQIGSIEGGRHAPNSYHYTGQAIDIPAAQVPVGKEKDLSAKVRRLIASFLGGTPQAKAAATIEDIPKPVLKNVPVGPTPSAAPINAARVAAAAAMGGNEKEAQRILEEGIKLKQKGIELGQMEAILQANQLPQLQQQGDALKQQIEARQKIVNLSDNAASIADIEAESRARLKQIEATRISALAQVQKQYKGDAALIKQINQQAELAAKIAKGEEEQRRANLELSNKLQNSDQARLQILQLQEGIAISKVELAALERRELQAGAVELLKASTLYQQSDEAQKSTLVTLTAQTEELQKQRQFMEKLVGLQLDATYTGAGLRSGRIGAEARAFEQGLKENKGDIGKATALADATRLAENERLVWGNLEKDIINTSDALSGSFTRGLLDVISGAKQMEDIGREVLTTIAGSFADSAQQQLSALLQRQFAGMLSGSIGTGTAAAGPQALSGASLTAAGSLGVLNNAALALGMTLQTIAGQSAFSGQIGGSGFAGLFGGATNAAAGGISAVAGGASGLLGFSSAIPQLAPTLESIPNFAGFFANGGRMFAGEFGVVGEEEPEFFFPGVSGTVVPRSKIEKAAELRQLNQQPQEIDVRYTVTEQHGERYVTEQQFRQGMAQTRQTAQAMFISSVRQNKDVRDSMRI